MIYNEAYDRPLLKSHGLNTSVGEFACAMEMYARFYGEWSDDWSSFRWQRLASAMSQCKLDGSGIAPWGTVRRPANW